MRTAAAKIDIYCCSRRRCPIDSHLYSRLDIVLSLLFFTHTREYHNKEILLDIHEVIAKKRRRFRSNQAAKQETKTKTQTVQDNTKSGISLAVKSPAAIAAYCPLGSVFARAPTDKNCVRVCYNIF